MVIITELGFEIDLINNYEYKSFEKTHIYKEIISEIVVKSAG